MINNKKGFTLVELLAVIVVLGIISIIAIPSVLDLIKQSKLDIYKRNEELLVNAARNYLTQKGLSLQDDQSMIITYQELKDNKIFDILKDADNNNECINSRVYITKTTNEYIYEPGLVCDNYISINTFDLLNGLGDFETDANSDGLADGWKTLITSSKSLSNDSAKNYYAQQIISDTSHTSKFQNRMGYPISNNKLMINRKFYFRIALKVDNYNNVVKFRYTARETLGNGNSLSTAISHNVTNNQYNYYSGINIINNTTVFLELPTFLFEMGLEINSTTTLTTMYCDDMVVLDLTEMYGVGKEPTVKEMDRIVSNSSK